ncbi:MAG: hydrogenase small subunit [Candidatus Competibacteraceae bacterium]|jgi:hydrogenase small subunit|nr:hydrogenase small subunit [Candidatus Competibacteraceae bacterium]
MKSEMLRVVDTSGNVLSRRTFLKFCTGVAASLGLSAGMGAQIAQAITNPRRTPVIWLSAQECTGCTESLLRSQHPSLETLILDLISLDYHEALSTPAGHLAEEVRHQSMEENRGKYLLVVDGSIPTKDGGIYCKIANKTALEHLHESAEGAAAIVAIGSCAAWGGIPASDPDPTEAKPVTDIIHDKPIVNIPGCPPNPYNFLSTILHFVTLGTLPELDDQLRPKFAYGRLIHENCERRPHFDAGRFATEYGDIGHRKGWCLYMLGCKGPETYANCPSILFGDVGSGSWPVGTGHPCFGCTEKGVGFTKPLHELSELKTVTPPITYPRIDQPVTSGISPAAAALAGGVAGAAAGAGAVVMNILGKAKKKDAAKATQDDADQAKTE